jgi:hypothetical protein
MRDLALWLWRIAVLATLIWVARELFLLRQDINQPADNGDTLSADSDDRGQTVDDLRSDMAMLNAKIDAIASLSVPWKPLRCHSPRMRPSS